MNEWILKNRLILMIKLCYNFIRKNGNL